MTQEAQAARPYAGVAADERREKRRAALMEAALDVVADGGVSAVSKRAVCSRARLNDRYFYEHFADAGALLEAVTRDLTASGLEAVAAAQTKADPDIRAQVRATALAALEFITADPRRGQLLLGSHTSEVLYTARLDSTRAIANTVAAGIREMLGADAASRFNTELAAYALVSGAMEIISGWLRGSFDVTKARIADLVAGLLLATADVSTALPRRRR